MCNLGSIFGGPSSGENAAAAGAASLSNTYAADFNQNYANQQDILGQLRSAYTPIVQAGPEQQGWSTNEAAAVNTQIGEGVGANYAKASQVLNNSLAAQGGGNEYLPTGASAALKGSLASSAANQLSSEQLSATEANYAQGRTNWQNALAGLSDVSKSENPTGFGTLAENENQNSFNDQKTINEQENQKMANILGAVTGVATSFIPGGSAFKALSGIGNLFSGPAGGSANSFATPGSADYGQPG